MNTKHVIILDICVVLCSYWVKLPGIEESTVFNPESRTSVLACIVCNLRWRWLAVFAFDHLVVRNGKISQKMNDNFNFVPTGVRDACLFVPSRQCLPPESQWANELALLQSTPENP